MSRAHRRGWHDNVVYAAEHDVACGARNGDVALTPAECRTLFTAITDDPAWPVPGTTLSFYGAASRFSSGGGWANWQTPHVSLNRFRLRRSDLLHELAHIVAMHGPGPKDRGHGRIFREVYLGLCDDYAPTFGRRLRVALRKRGVIVP